MNAGNYVATSDDSKSTARLYADLDCLAGCEKCDEVSRFGIVCKNIVNNRIWRDSLSFQRHINYLLIKMTDLLLKICKKDKMTEFNLTLNLMNQIVLSQKLLQRVESGYIISNLVQSLKTLENTQSITSNPNILETYKLDIINFMKEIYGRFICSARSDCWNCFLPYSNRITIASLLRDEKLPKVKSQLICLIERGIKSLKRLLSCAQKSGPKGRYSIFTVSNQVAISLSNLHSIIIDQLKHHENTVLTTVHLLKCLSVLIKNTSYHQIDRSVAVEVYELLIEKFKISTNVNALVAIIRCLNNLLEKSQYTEELKCCFLKDISYNPVETNNDIERIINTIINPTDYSQTCPDKFKKTNSSCPQVLRNEANNLNLSFRKMYNNEIEATKNKLNSSKEAEKEKNIVNDIKDWKINI